MSPIRDDSYRDQDLYQPFHPDESHNESLEEESLNDEAESTPQLDPATAAALQNVQKILNSHPFAIQQSKRYKSSFTIFGIPFLAISKGPDIEKGEMYGHAKGIIAIGDVATGLLAIGGIARGLFALGGLALGGFTLGGCSIGLLTAVGGFALGTIALGGCAVGGIALGGAAIGGLAIGGCAIGYAAVGAAAIGQHTIGPLNQDPALVDFFNELGKKLGIM